MDTPIALFVRKTLIVLLLVGLALLLVQLADVLLLIFGAILIAAVVRAIADPLERIRIPGTAAVLISMLVVLGIVGLFAWLFGAQIGAQLSAVAVRLPDAARNAREWLQGMPLARPLLSATPDFQSMAGQAFQFAFGAFGAITNLVVVVIAAIYLALEPRYYRLGVERLFPKEQSDRVGAALSAAGVALKKYLLGQLFTMTIVGTMVAIGLSLVGVPSAAALGLIVGLANFIPMIGPFIGAVPGVLLALGQSPELALWATIVYFVAQQIEGNVLTPIVQRHAVSIPPALLLFALAGLGALFGPVGVILAAPLAVVIFTLVTMLWTRDTLGHDVAVPGQ